MAAVQLISILRLVAAVVFSAIAFQQYPAWLIVGVYLVAAFSDLLDGFLARRLSVSSFAGTAIDLISDKSLTVISLLYAAACGITILPLALIAVRELISLGFRIIEVNGTQLLPTSRVFGGIMATLLWGNTVLLVVFRADERGLSAVASVYWVCAAILAMNIAWRMATSRKRIMSALTAASEQD